jgi:Ala-tRNA(Pro) deacylase
MGLMNDHDHHVQLLIDRELLKGEYFGCHPCENTASLRIRTADLMEKFLPAVHHEALLWT